MKFISEFNLIVSIVSHQCNFNSDKNHESIKYFSKRLIKVIRNQTKQIKIILKMDHQARI